jgi:chromosome segregation ATPase
MRSYVSTIAVLSVCGMVAAGAFQRGPAAQQPETTRELLVEVRALRVALENLASAGPRVQLMFGRLQLQEQRITGLTRRLGELREKTKVALAQEEALRARVASYDTFLKTASAADPERDELEQEMPRIRKELARLTSDVQQLQQEEASVAAEIGLEQGRWTEINQRLEELERALVRR